MTRAFVLSLDSCKSLVQKTVCASGLDRFFLFLFSSFLLFFFFFCFSPFVWGTKEGRRSTVAITLAFCSCSHLWSRLWFNLPVHFHISNNPTPHQVNQWDCETIVSTYSNMDNHPSVLGTGRKAHPRRPRGIPASVGVNAEEGGRESASPVQQVALSDRTGLPLGVLPERTFNDKWGLVFLLYGGRRFFCGGILGEFCLLDLRMKSG